MKKLAVVVMAALLMSSTVPALAQMTKEEKDQCLLASKNCATEVDSIQKRIKKLQTEIKKGKKVYSAEELKKLEAKLNEVKQLLNEIEEGGSN
jgi:septal ring factor EnvC (AmiA/AmiB activator)